MAITLVAAVTTGDPALIAATGNTYGTQAEASTYLTNRYGGGCFATDAEEQRQLLLAAMRVLSRKRFIGVRATTDQPLDWPRVSEQIGAQWNVAGYNTIADTFALYDIRGQRITSREIPTRLKEAQFEIALAMHKDAEAERTPWMATIKKSGKSAEVVYERKAAGYLPTEAKELLSSLLLSSLGAIR